MTDWQRIGILPLKDLWKFPVPPAEEMIFAIPSTESVDRSIKVEQLAASQKIAMSQAKLSWGKIHLLRPFSYARNWLSVEAARKAYEELEAAFDSKPPTGDIVAAAIAYRVMIAFEYRPRKKSMLMSHTNFKVEN